MGAFSRAFNDDAHIEQHNRRVAMEAKLRDPRVRALLDTIGEKESNNQYNVKYGGETFDDYSAHPGPFEVNGRTYSAAGKYQFLESTWNEHAGKLGLTDFSPHSQDLAAVSLLDEIGAIDQVMANNPMGAISIASERWDALPYGVAPSGYGGISRFSRQPRSSYNYFNVTYHYYLSRHLSSPGW